MKKVIDYKIIALTVTMTLAVAACSPDSTTEPEAGGIGSTNSLPKMDEKAENATPASREANSGDISQQEKTETAALAPTPPFPSALPKKDLIEQVVQETTEKIKEIMKYEVVHVNASEAKELLEKNSEIKVLDVRTPEEFAQGRIASALNIDFRNPEFAKNLSNLDSNTEYIVHCKSGGRSSAALAIFEKLGFGKVYHLDGGFDGWKSAGNDFQTKE